MNHKSQLNICLLDSTNDFVESNIKSVPVGIGYVGSYCKHKFKDDVSITAFRSFDLFYDKIVKVKQPDIVGLGCYDWNYNLSKKIAAFIKERFPECLIVFGGPSIMSDPEDNRKLLSENPFIDLLVSSDGEFPFANIIQLLFDFREKADRINMIKSKPIDGVSALNGGNIVMGKPFDIVKDLSSLPSPYLTGFLDDFLEDVQLVPIIQNVRGCPYTCSFCVSGKQVSKLRSFTLERVSEEIDYIRCHTENKVLRFADDNFGIVSGDLEVAKYLRHSYDEYKYPVVLKVPTAKKTNDLTRQITKILKPLNLMNISLQTLTPYVLKNIKRPHTSMEEIIRNLEFARKNNIATCTDLIFGLPGESVESFKTTLDKTFELRLDSIALGVLWLLNGSEISSDMREQYQYKGMYMLSENAITYNDYMFSIEVDEIAVSSKDFSFEDWKTALQYVFFVQLMVYHGYAKELLCHFLTFDIKLTDVITELFSNTKKYPVINNAFIEYRKQYMGLLYEREEDIYEEIKSKIDKYHENKESVELIGQNRITYFSLTRLIYDDSSYEVFDEIANASLNLYKGNQLALFKETTEHVKDLTIKLIINPKNNFEDKIEFNSHYNLKGWIEDGFTKPLWDYLLPNHKPFYLCPRNIETARYAIKMNQEHKKSSFYFLRYTNSSDRRRVVYEN